MLPAGFSIREPRGGDLAALHGIEARATALLAAHGHPALADIETSMEDLAAFLRSGTTFVAVDAADEPRGFAVARDIGDLYWLGELSVDPALGRRGIGSALLDAVVERARWAFHSAVGLSTFRDVPFNAPFYARRGFLEVGLDDAPAAIRARVESEVPTGAKLSERVLMVRKL